MSAIPMRMTDRRPIRLKLSASRFAESRMALAYIGLGSNLDDPAAQLGRALAAIATIPGVTLLRQSRLYRSPPMGPPEQPDYCNAVCLVEAQITPAELMSALLAIERGAGRVRGERWGPRRIDLDLLHVDGVVLDTEGLRLPHPGIASRSFVLVPWAEIAPDLELPRLGPVAALAARVATEGLTAWHHP